MGPRAHLDQQYLKSHSGLPTWCWATGTLFISDFLVDTSLRTLREGLLNDTLA